VSGVLAVSEPLGAFSIERVEAAARQALSPEAQAAAWAAGQALPIEQVIAEALAQAGPAEQQEAD
jgi:hypothetical protein